MPPSRCGADRQASASTPSRSCAKWALATMRLLRCARPRRSRGHEETAAGELCSPPPIPARRQSMDGLTQTDWIDQRVFDLYDEYCHGRIDRRAFLQQAAAVTVGGLAMAQALMPRYANAQTISFTDERIKAKYVSYPSPGGNSGTMRGYLVQPAGNGPFPAV